MIYFAFLPDYKNKINISGNAIMNKMMYSRYFDKKKDILLNATSKKDILIKIKKIYYAIIAFLLVVTGKQKKIYTVMFDDKGFYLQVIFLFILSFFCKKIIVHHHSFKYLDKSKILILLKSKKINHIAISKKQYSKLKKNYFFKSIYLIQGYIFHLNRNIKIKNKKNTDKIKIIFHSRINENKGICEYLKLSKEFSENKKVMFSIFGNECSDVIKKKILKLKKLKIIDEFKLNISKKEKNKMYKNNDILILPTKHKSETTPGVIDECINHGVIPIAFNQGDIKGQIGEMGLVANNYIQMKKKLLMVFKNYNKIKKRIIDNKKIKLNTVSQKLKILDNIFYN